MTAMQLKPCPWCDIKPRIRRLPPLYTLMIRFTAGCEIHYECYGDTEEEAAKLWNTRAPIPSDDATVERVAKAIFKETP